MKAWRSLNDFSLGSKIAALMSILVLLTMLILTLASILRERQNFQQELILQGSLFLETTSLSIRDPLYRVELDELYDLARAVSDNPNVNAFIIYDAQGKILVDSSRLDMTFSQQVDALGKNLIELANNQEYISWQPQQLTMGRAVVVGTQSIGAVSTAFSTAALDQKIASITRQGVLLGLLTLLMGAGLTIILARQITIPLSELSNGAARMAEGDLTVRVHPLSKDEIGRLAEAFNQMAAGLQEREWLRDMFGRFVSPEVAEAMNSGRLQLAGESRHISVLFCDIRDFTEFSENHSPQEVVAILNQYLSVVVQAAQKNKGMVNKFGGDSSLIIYGAPNDVEDSAYKAVLTALDIRDALEQLNLRLQENGEAPLRVGVGINTGPALAGAVGPNERQEYTVIGNTVNLAARIDGLNKQFPEHDILISRSTYHELAGHQAEFEMQSLGQINIRGKLKPLEIWAVKNKW